MNTQQLHRAGLKLFGVAMLVFVGMYYGEDFWGAGYKPWWDDFYADVGFWLYWSGAGLLSGVLVLGKLGRNIVSYFRFQARVKPSLPGLGKERNALLNAAMAIHREQEERAIGILEAIDDKAHPDVCKTARWMRALAAVRHMKRNRRLVSGYQERFPQTYGLIFSHGRVPLRRTMMTKEWEELKSADIDSMVHGYLELMDEMIRILDRPEAAFHAQAEEILQYVTGYSFLLGTKERYQAWWEKMRPVLVRGGGALLMSVRLIQREYYREAQQMLGRLRTDGLLSDETETLRRLASFFAMAARPQWRLSGEDMERFFRDLFYHGSLEMGVLRFPTAELQGVVKGCQRGKDFREAKISFIEDTLSVWERFGDELGGPLSVLMKRLLNHKGRQCPARLNYWRKQWQKCRKKFEAPIGKIMEGVALVGTGDLDAADACFMEAMELDSSLSTPLVNIVFIRLAQNREVEARHCAQDVLRRFPKDAGALVALGRMFATKLEDTEMAEDLFQRAREIDRAGIEPLICLGEVKLMEGKYNESQAYFDLAKELDSTSPEAKLGLSRMYMETKRYKLAIANLQSVSKDGKGDARHFAHYLLYRAYRDMGDHRCAIEFLDKVPTPFFREPDLLDDIAFHLETEKEYAKARTFSERAMVLRAQSGERGEGFEPMGEI